MRTLSLLAALLTTTGLALISGPALANHDAAAALSRELTKPATQQAAVTLNRQEKTETHNGTDDAAGHDANDDHGVDGAGHDAGDDHGNDGAETDNDHGNDGAEAGDDHGGDDSSSGGDDSSGDDSSGGGDDHGGDDHGGDDH